MVCTISGTQSFDIDREEVELEAATYKPNAQYCHRKALAKNHPGQTILDDAKQQPDAVNGQQNGGDKTPSAPVTG